MIKQKFKLSEYKKPTFLQQYIDRGIIECSDIQFVDFTKINIKRASNRIRQGNATSPKSLSRIAKYENQFENDGGWNPHFPCAVYLLSYGKDGEEFNTVGYNHKTIASHNKGHNPPGVIIKWKDGVTDAQQELYYDELLAHEQTDARVNQDNADDNEIKMSLSRAKLNFEAILLEGTKTDFKDAEEYLNSHLKNIWEKDPKQKKWVNVLKKILGDKSSFSNITDYSSVTLGSEYIRDSYDGDFNFKSIGKIKDDFIFDNNTHQIIKGSNQLFKPEFIYSGTLRRRFGDIIIDLSKSDKRGDNFVFSLFFALGGKQKHITSGDIDKERKLLIEEVEYFYDMIKKMNLQHRVLLIAFLGQKVDEISKLVDYETEKKRLIK